MPKLKKMPNTKRQQKYMGLQTVKRVTDSHVVISQDQLGKQREKRIPIHMLALTLNGMLICPGKQIL